MGKIIERIREREERKQELEREAKEWERRLENLRAGFPLTFWLAEKIGPWLDKRFPPTARL